MDAFLNVYPIFVTLHIVARWLASLFFINDFMVFLESIVPGKPTSLRVRPLANSIVVSWTPPTEQDIMIRGYVLGYGVGVPDIFRQVLDSRLRYYTIKALSRQSLPLSFCSLLVDFCLRVSATSLAVG